MGSSASDDEIKDFISKKALLFDVRSEGEYSYDRLDVSTNIPVGIIAKSKLLPKDKNVYIICFCASGARSGGAVSTLKNMGYKNVINGGGLSNMKKFFM